jgi:hypothetical protein
MLILHTTADKDDVSIIDMVKTGFSNALSRISGRGS